MSKVSLGQAVRVKTSQRRAMLVELLDDGGKKLWVPDYAVHADSEVFAGGGKAGELVVNDRWAEEKGLL